MSESAISECVKHLTLSPAILRAIDSLHDPEVGRSELKHKRLRREHSHLRVAADLRGKGDTIGRSTLDPELARVVSLCLRAPNKRTGKLSARPASEQPQAWVRARDAYAAKNYSLCFRAADKQWRRNQHLAREVVPCAFCEGAACPRCKGRGRYKAQPDLLNLAYLGLLEAIRCFDAEKASCISTYAVHTMKQSMMQLLRQTPVFYPPDLLKDRRTVAAERKRVGRDLTEAEAEAAIVDLDASKCETDKQRAKVREKGARQRALLALNCYYGQERKSVETLHDQYVQRSTRDDGKRQRKGRAAVAVGALSCEQPRIAEDEDLSSALDNLSAEQRTEVERFLRGRGQVSDSTVAYLREAML